MAEEDARTDKEPRQEETGREESRAEAGGASGAADDRRDLSWHLDRIWREIKDLTRQVEQETRRGGRIARLRFEIRGLRQDLEGEAARLGRLVYEAQMAGGKRPALARVEGYDAAVERIADLEARIEAKEEHIVELRRQGEPDPEA